MDKIQRNGLYSTFFKAEKNFLDNSQVFFYLIFHPSEDMMAYIGLRKVSEPFPISQPIVDSFKGFIRYLIKTESEEVSEVIGFDSLNPKKSEYDLQLEKYDLDDCILISWSEDIGRATHYMGPFFEWKLNITLHHLNSNKLRIYAKLDGKDFINDRDLNIIVAHKQLMTFTPFT